MPPQRLASQIAALETLNPTILCLQEMWNLQTIQQYAEKFKDTHVALSSGHDLTSKLQRFVSYHMVFLVLCSPAVLLGALLHWPAWQWLLLIALIFPSLTYYLLGSRRIFDTLVYGDQMGLTTLVPREMEVASVTRGAFKSQSRELSVAGLWEWGHGPRGFLEIKGTLWGKQLHIINAHLNLGVVNSGRMKQTKELIALCENDHDDTLVVIAGDFNADAAQPEMRLFGSSRFCDVISSHYHCPQCSGSAGGCAQCFHGGCTWHTANPLTRGCLREPNQRMDHILARGAQVQAAELALHDPPCSDHFAVLTRLTWLT